MLDFSTIAELPAASVVGASVVAKSPDVALFPISALISSLGICSFSRSSSDSIGECGGDRSCRDMLSTSSIVAATEEARSSSICGANPERASLTPERCFMADVLDKGRTTDDLSFIGASPTSNTAETDALAETGESASSSCGILNGNGTTTTGGGDEGLRLRTETLREKAMTSEEGRPLFIVCVLVLAWWLESIRVDVIASLSASLSGP
jgi:hypothetical protein